MGTWIESATKKSYCFMWLIELISRDIIEFKFKDLPEKLKNKSMLHRAAASGLLTETNIDNNGVKTWKLNIYEIMRISEDF